MRSRPTTVGGDSALALEMAGARVLCGLGPARAEVARDERLAALAGGLAATVSAVVWGEQVHGTVIASVARDAAHPVSGVACVGRCDGLVTDAPGVAVLVWTADCVPLVLAGGGVVAAIHAGWRGAAAGIVARAVRRLAVEYGVDAGDLGAVVGPAVGACHYEVGDEVTAALARWNLADESWRQGRRVDLRAFVRAHLLSLGVPAPGIAVVGGCTACEPGLASYRRDGAASGRQWTLAFIPSPP